MSEKQKSEYDAADRPPIIAFVWQPERIVSPVAQMAQRTGSRAVFDLSALTMDGVRSVLHESRATGLARDIKVSTSVLMDASFAPVLQGTAVQQIWVELAPPCVDGDVAPVLKRLRVLAETYRCFPVVGDVDLVVAMVTDSAGIGNIVLKGCEASGFASAETTLVLYAAVREMLRASSSPPNILIWGGIWTPEAAAAFIATGAAGIVFESVHWLTDLVTLDEQQRQQLAKFRVDSTALVGLELQVPCRLFNKGNSRAFAALKTQENTLCAEAITDAGRGSFVRHLQGLACHPLTSQFSPDEVIPLGVEAAFAAWFAERFGTNTEGAVSAFMAAILALCDAAEAQRECFLDSPVAKEMGITYPFIQGAMTCVTEVPEFAAQVADAGGLPAIALGLMDRETIDKRLGRLTEVMGERPYALNVISLAENPRREMHLAWIKERRPRFVWIAGGDLSPIKELLAAGIEVVYIAPDTALLGLALEAGVRYVVCEGYEAGGHVGPHSMLTLAQMVLDMKRRQPSLFHGRHVILAGGIYDRETAFRAVLLGADAVQMGTAYLATREIVETGALTALYQRMIAASRPGGTVISGQTTGLRVRSLRTARVAAVLTLEREFAAGRQDEQTFRTKIEALAAGSLFVAARGVDRRSGMALDEDACLDRGQFMVGACSGAISKVQTLKDFHHGLATGALSLRPPFAWPTEGTPAARSASHCRPVSTRAGGYDRIAITGMSIVNSLGNSPAEIWAASVAMKSGITLVPASRWQHETYYDPRPRHPDKTYAKIGAFMHVPVSRTELGIPPQDFRTMTEATKITLWLADQAIRASGILDSGIAPERIGVLLSQNSGEAAVTLTDITIRAYAHDIVQAVNRAVALTPDQAHAIEQEVMSLGLMTDDTTLLGRLNSSAAGFICNRYGFMGPSYSVSAACATSLVALYSAVQMIQNGIIDAAIVGGAEEILAPLHYLEFSALGALFGLSGRDRPPHECSRPFDAERDGMVMGEGGGMLVIERESLARARQAQVHAVITSVGASNNPLGMVESSSTSQLVAMRASFLGLPYGPDAVDLVECHATSTRQGDVQEVRALREFYPTTKRTVLTSFKSQVGHTLGAAGISNIIRGAMAMQAGVLPGTLNYEHPDPEMGLDKTNFLITPEPIDWQRRGGQARRLQVNAFGFGGFNYIVQLEESRDATADDSAPKRATQHAAPEILHGVSVFRAKVIDARCRIAVVAPSDDAALTAIAASPDLAGTDILSPKAARSLAQQGIYIGLDDAPVPPLAFVFPGQGAHYPGMGRVLYDTVPIIREWLDRTAATADFDLLRILFHGREEDLQNTRWQQPALFALEHAIAQYLLALGVRPVALAGHSLGELTALCLAGVYSLEDGFRIVNKRALCMDKAATMHADPGVMAATDAPLELLIEMIQGRDGVHISNINSPKQVVLSGDEEAVKAFGIELKESGHRFKLLKVSMAFHSPIMRVIHDEFAAYLATIPFQAPQIPVISNTTMRPYPEDPDEIRGILVAHLESSVHWMSNSRTLWNDFGIRHFVEVGPGDILSTLISDTEPAALCLQTCLPPSEDRACTIALAQLVVHGHLPPPGDLRVVTIGVAEPEPVSTIAESPEPVDPPEATDESESAEVSDSLESVIRIIMDATGFDRDEIQPDMDLRRDLSIRSSRLPIIMDAAERQFGIVIELEDFQQVHTVRDVAQRISVIVARDTGGVPPPGARTADADASTTAAAATSPDAIPLKRVTFVEVPVTPGATAPMRVLAGESVLLVSTATDDETTTQLGDLLKADYDVDTLLMQVASATIPHKLGLVGLVITLPAVDADILSASQTLKSLVARVQEFLRSPTRKFVVLMHPIKGPDGSSEILAQGLLGFFLTVAQEYPAVQFRTVAIDAVADLRSALHAALDAGCTDVELRCRGGRTYTTQGQVTPSVFTATPSLKLGRGDVVVMSGGATGISAHLARSLAPYSPRLIFLGRTVLAGEPRSHDDRSREIEGALADLQTAGIEATYYTCDVTDSAAVRTVLGEVVSRYGRIDGIIHGAGVLRDSWLDEMSAEDFSCVADVKVLGAWNLFTAAQDSGLRFFVGLSSVASIQGNPGQANYSAANRMMAALLRDLGRRHRAICCKALMLPPIEGAGMADDPTVRDMLARRGVGYIHAQELAGLFCRELFIAPAADAWVMFMRTLPALKTVRLADSPGPARGGELAGGTVSYSPAAFPMADAIIDLDLQRQHLQVARTFSAQHDLWLADHRPLKSGAHPLVSAAMVLETFMEAARLLCPHLGVSGVRHVQFLDMIPCPKDLPRASRTACQLVDAGLREAVCDVSLAIQEISPAGTAMDRFTSHCSGQVLLGGGGELGVAIPDFPLRSGELHGKSVSERNLLNWYKSTGLNGRYRVLDCIDGTGTGVIRGRTTYRESRDFAQLPDAHYQYPPYLFEALLQVVGFYMVTIDAADPTPVLPIEVGEMRFLRQCRAGERITLEARLRARDRASLTWDARGVDDQGHTVMHVRLMRLQWISG